MPKPKRNVDPAVLYEMRRDNVIEAIHYLTVKKREAPSAREVATVSGIPQGSIREILNRMRDEGFVTWNPELRGRQRRLIQLTPEARQRHTWRVTDQFGRRTL